MNLEQAREYHRREMERLESEQLLGQKSKEDSDNSYDSFFNESNLSPEEYFERGRLKGIKKNFGDRVFQDEYDKYSQERQAKADSVITRTRKKDEEIATTSISLADRRIELKKAYPTLAAKIDSGAEAYIKGLWTVYKS